MDGYARKPWTSLPDETRQPGSFYEGLKKYLSFSRDLEGYLRVLNEVAVDTGHEILGSWIDSCLAENEKIERTDADGADDCTKKQKIEEAHQVASDVECGRPASADVDRVDLITDI